MLVLLCFVGGKIMVGGGLCVVILCRDGSWRSVHLAGDALSGCRGGGYR
jgi:hypothetical protein